MIDDPSASAGRDSDTDASSAADPLTEAAAPSGRTSAEPPVEGIEPAAETSAEPPAERIDPAAETSAEPPVERIEPAAETSAERIEPAAEPPAASTEAPSAPGMTADAEPAPIPEAPLPTPVSVGRAIAETLRAGGVRWAFTVPGESFLGLLDALGEVGIRVVTTRHEGGAAFMAEAVGQLTGRPAMCLGTRAVGASNLAIGIHTAKADSTPMIAAIGQVERRLQGHEAFQETDIVATIGGLAKWAAEPRTAADAARVAAEAIRRATSGRPGPVVLSLPEDLLEETVTPALGSTSPSLPTSRPDPATVRAILRLLARARRPVIIAGAGVLRARCSSDLVKLAELLRVPVIASWRHGDVISNDHPLYLGMAGLSAPHTVRSRLDAADAILALGTRLGEVTTFGYAYPRDGQDWAHVDLEPREGSGDLAGPGISLVADARTFVRSALDLLRGAALDAETTDARVAANANDRAAWETATVVDDGAWAGPGVHPGRIVATLRRVLPDDAIVTTDAGNMAGWLARGFRLRRPGTFLGPTSGAMGFGLPAAIGAALVHRERPVVAWVGDGGLAMTMAELETAVREHVRVVVVVLDNERYGTIRMHQEQRGGPTPATDLGPVDFALVARGLGANGVRLEAEADFEAALRTAVAADRPTVIQLSLDRRWISVDRRP
jgi:acetolactate synthase-1/2/3 large subunit